MLKVVMNSINMVVFVIGVFITAGCSTSLKMSADEIQNHAHDEGIIVDGKTRVHDGGRTLNYLGGGDVFGEMAVLDTEPRVASVTAVEDARLFRLDQEAFYELMDDQIEVARGIIHVLSQHLRARVRDLSDLRTRLEALEQSSEIRKG